MYEIYNADCLEKMKDIKDKSVDMILCDLPYGTTKNKWDCPIDLIKLWEEYKRIIKNDGAILLFAQIPFSIQLAYSNLEWLKYEWIWEKEQGTGFLNANRMPMKSHENILVFYKKLPTYNPQFTVGEPYSMKKRNHYDGYGHYELQNEIHYDGKRYPKTVLKYPRENKSLHPTQKPVTLLEYLIKTYTNENEIVLDNCMGSGSTIIAAINTNRKFIGIEKDKDIFETAKKRIEGVINNGKL